MYKRQYPVRALQTMVRVASYMEQNINYNEIFKKRDRAEDPDITLSLIHI